jgi:hypothetical protein
MNTSVVNPREQCLNRKGGHNTPSIFTATNTNRYPHSQVSIIDNTLLFSFFFSIQQRRGVGA